MSRDLVARLSGGIFLKTGTSVVTVVVGLASSVILNRSYGKSGYGLLVLVYSVTALCLAVSDLGGKVTMSRVLPLWIKQGKERDAVHLFGAALALQLAGIATFGFLMFTASHFIAHTLFRQPALSALLVVGVGYFAAFALFDFFVQTFQALQDWGREGCLNLLFAGLQMLSVCVVALGLGWEITWVVVGNALAALGTVAMAIVWLPSRFRNVLRRPVLSKMAEAAGTVVRFGLPLVIGSVYRFMIAWFDKILLGRFASPADVALYHIATTLINGIMIFFKVLPMIFSPYVAEISDSSTTELARKFGLIFRWFLQAAILASFLVFFTVEPVVLALYGESYAAVVPLTRALLLVFFLRASRDPFHIFLTYALSRVRTVVILGTTLTVVTVATAAILVPVYGTWGAVGATVTGNVVTSVVLLVLAPTLRDMTPVSSVRMTAGALAVVGILYALLAHTPIPGTLLGLGLAFLYLATLLALREVRKEDLGIAREVLRSGHRLLIPSGNRRTSL